MSHLDYLDLQTIDTEHGTVGVGIGVTTTGLYRLGIAVDATDRIDIHLTSSQARAHIDELTVLVDALEALERNRS